MIKILKYLFCITLIPGALGITYAQEVYISPNTVDENGFGYVKVIGQDESGYYLLLSNLTLNSESDRMGFRSRKYKMARYDLKLNKKWSKAIEEPDDDGIVDGVTFFNNQVYIITSSYNRGEKKVNYSATAIDSTGKLSAVPGNIASFTDVTGDYEKGRLVVSLNRQLLCIAMREFTSDTSQTLYTAVLNGDMKAISVKSVTVNFPEKKFAFEGYALSVKGDLAVLGFHSEKVKTFSSKRKIEFYLYASEAGAANFKEYKIPSEKNISELGITFDNFNNHVVLAGFYYDRESQSGSGILYATLDMNRNDSLQINTRIIDSQKNVRLRNMASGSGIVDYPIEKIVVRNDGGALLVAEEAYTTEYSYYDYFSQSFTQRTEYHFENVVIISVNSDGSVDWSAVVEKDQVSLDDNGVFSSFCSLLNSDQLVILYNDDISRHNSIMPASIDNKGKLARVNAIAKLDNYLMLPRSGKQVSENEILIPVFRKRDLFLARLTF
jgi:hypothetical protein